MDVRSMKLSVRASSICGFVLGRGLGAIRQAENSCSGLSYHELMYHRQLNRAKVQPYPRVGCI